jgi:hypothetical protein
MSYKIELMSSIILVGVINTSHISLSHCHRPQTALCLSVISECNYMLAPQPEVNHQLY